MMKRKKLFAEQDQASVDLTPMLDVVFIMLIFFVVTASFLSEQSVPLETSPPDKPQQEQASGGLVVNISADDQYFIGTATGMRRVDAKALRSVLLQQKHEKSLVSVMALADENASTQAYVNLVEAAQGAGLQASLTTQRARE